MPPDNYRQKISSYIPAVSPSLAIPVPCRYHINLEYFGYTSLSDLRGDLLSCLTFPCQYGRLMPAAKPGSFPDDPLQNPPGLRDLISSDESFLGMLEAMHYLNFPGF